MLSLLDPAKRKQYDASGVGVDPEQAGGGGFKIDPCKCLCECCIELLYAVYCHPYLICSCVLVVPPIADVFFSILFGSDQVEPYIGELGLASSFDAFLKLAEMGDGSMSFESWDDMKSVLGWGETALKRRKREAEIAMNLRDRISDYVDGYLAEDAFKVSCWNEAVSISKGGSYGASFLSAIGPAVSIDLGAVVFVPTMPSTC